MTTPAPNRPGIRAPLLGASNTGGVFRYLASVGVVLTVLMVTLEPDVGFAAPPAARLLFWTLEVGSGLVVLQSVLHLLALRFGAGRLPSWSLVLLSGMLGSMVLAPVYWLIGEGLMEHWLGYPTVPDDEGDDLFGMVVSNPLVEEFVEIVGPVTTAWALICLPRLHWLMPPLLHGTTPRAKAVQPFPAGSETIRSSASAAATRPDPLAPGHHAPVDPAEVAPGAAATAPVPSSTPLRGGWRERLPMQLGQDVIAVASELQYLRVWTPRGCALILGSLAEVESEDPVHGLRVHRSWWVALEHVISVRRTPGGAVCLMSDGRQVPVSRRRRADVLARFGDGVQYRVAAGSKAVAETDLH